LDKSFEKSKGCRARLSATPGAHLCALVPRDPGHRLPRRCIAVSSATVSSQGFNVMPITCSPLLPFPACTPHRARASLRFPLLCARPPHPKPELITGEHSMCRATHRACAAIAPSLTRSTFCTGTGVAELPCPTHRRTATSPVSPFHCPLA
jgi:hypothetical protein